ncbi:hypothetical protein CUU66_04455 [Peribacillus deserti]|uniref:Uncharacterized protein n=1 Tax=Peribacillus deserti TaxID=673318 RepID=A0A2N5M9N2_9BACI|nr:hypothetical protein CUU66_04455 [Peribacillus deserti]
MRFGTDPDRGTVPHFPRPKPKAFLSLLEGQCLFPGLFLAPAKVEPASSTDAELPCELNSKPCPAVGSAMNLFYIQDGLFLPFLYYIVIICDFRQLLFSREWGEISD